MGTLGDPAPSARPPGGGRFEGAPVLAVGDLDDPGTTEEEALHVASARVVVADYALLRRDFPELELGRPRRAAPRAPRRGDADGARSPEEAIDRWLIDNAAFVSRSQAAQCAVNTPIETDGITRRAFRPSGYGRALVVPVGGAEGERGGLLDIKGAGVSAGSVPRRGDHSDGLDYVGAALSDYALQRLIDEIFRRAAPGCETVPTYAVLDLGFDVVDGWHGTSPAGLHVRRAHRRPPGGLDLPRTGSVEEAVKLRIELLLRHYGLTSASPGTAFDVAYAEGGPALHYAGKAVGRLSGGEIAKLDRLRRDGRDRIHLEGVNLQLAREVGLKPCRARVVDFGHINARDAFAHPVTSLVSDRLLHIGGIVWPEDGHFVQPEPELGVPVDDWKLGRLHARFFGLARRFRCGGVAGAEVAGEIARLVERTVERWPS